MAKLHYEKIGLKCGLEIHQQLNGTKLFCQCDPHITERTDFDIHRQLTSVSGEAGKTDIAVEAESKRQRRFTYTGSAHCNCLVDTDESPPQPLNTDALNTVLLFSKMVDATPVDFAQTMRKIVIDGSNTTGFQRTTLVATNGTVLSSNGPVRIATVIVEEDSAQKRNESAGTVTYNLDRLGIPLIEIGTEPDITTPEHAQEVAAHLGMLLRSTGRVRRGQGTIRQDVNVSIASGDRVEIKGAQDLKLIPTIVEEEITRQQVLVHLKNEWIRQKCVVGKIIDLTYALSSSTSKVIKSALDTGGVVLGIRITNATGLLGHEVQSGRRFGTELANYAKVAAGVKGLFHSDELPKYGITLEEVNSVREQLKARSQDAFILVATTKDIAKRALHAVIARLEMTSHGVIREVRNALSVGTSEYLRPLPGAGRMYPETDIPLTRIDKVAYKKLKLPELVTERATRYEKSGLSKDLALYTAKSERFILIDELLKKCKNLKPGYLAETVHSIEADIKSQTGKTIEVQDADLREVLLALDKGKIAKESVLDVLAQDGDISAILPNYTLLSKTELKQAVKTLLKQHKDTNPKAIMGIAMKALRGKAPGREINKLVTELLKQPKKHQ